MAIYKRGKNYYLDFIFEGVRVRQRYGPSRKGAENAIHKIKAEIAEGRFLNVARKRSRVKFHDFAVQYMKWSKANKEESTYKRELSVLGQLDKEFGEKALHEITTWQIEKYKAGRKEKIKHPGAVKGCVNLKGPDGQEKRAWFVDYRTAAGRKLRRYFGDDQRSAEAFFSRSNEPLMPATINREVAMLKHMYSKAIEWGKLKESPAKKVKMLKGEVKRVRFLLPAEIHQLLACCEGTLKPLVTLVLNTGLRAGEVFRLTWNAINIELGILSVLKSKNHERRDISLNQTARAALESLERRTERVFSDGDGKPFSRVPKSFHAALRKAAISDFRFHDLRHTFASNLVMQGVDIMTVKELLGHKTLEMTMRYSHLAPAHKTKAVSVLDRVMSQISPQAAEAVSQVIPIRS